jgi:hypothetical protein
MPTMTITTNNAQAQRIATAFGRLKNRRNPDKSPRDATAAEVKSDTVDFLRSTVVNYERDVATQAASDGVPDLVPPDL